MKLRFARLIVSSVCIAFLAGALVPSAASASTIDDQRAEAQRLQQQIDANGEKISMLAERYDAAELRLDTAKKETARVQRRLAGAQAETARLQTQVGRRAASMYMRSGIQSPLDFLDTSSVAAAGSRAKYAATTAALDVAALDRLRASREDLHVAENQLERARSDAQKEVDAIEASRREVESANAKQAQLLAQVKGEIATLIKQEQARQAALEKARSDARLRQLRAQQASDQTSAPSSPGGRDPSGLPPPNVPAPSPGAAAAVAYAKAQLGKPYRYAGVGPDAYDCSGLTMMAWAQGGVSMPHGSIAQGNMFPRVPDNAMEPGDLVIYYPDHHHVGMYVGGGMTISATHTGDFVRLQPVFRSGFQFAVRPG